MRKILSLLLVTVLISCGKQRVNIDSLFDTEIKVSHSVAELRNNEFLSFVFQLALSDNYLLTHERGRRELFSMIDIDSGLLVARFGIQGQGPNEFNSPSDFVILNDSIMTIFDFGFQSLFQINYKKDFHPSKKQEFSRDALLIINAIPISNERYIGLGAFEEGRYLLLDENGNVLSYNFQYPIPTDGAILPTPLHQFLAFQGILGRRPSGQTFFFAGRSSEILEIITLEENDKLKKVFQYHGETARFIPDGDGVSMGGVAIRRESKMFFISASSTDDYLYLLYSNRVIGDNEFNAIKSNQILVFDWNGNPITKLLLDIDVNQIAVHNSNKFMYAYTEDLEKLVRFELELR